MATGDLDPFEQLLRSHRRLEERLTDLPVAAKDLDGPRRAEALAYIEDTLAWMGRAVRRHEEDEERSLFPRLRGRPELDALINKLAGEHQLHEQLQAELGAVAATDAARARALVDELTAVYATHIREEETELFPGARTVLLPEELAAICTEMDARRGR